MPGETFMLCHNAANLRVSFRPGSWSCCFFLFVALVVSRGLCQAQEIISDIESTFSPDGAFLQGLEISSYIAREFELVDDEEMIERVNNIGYSVSYWASEPDVIYSFNIVKMKEPNAFALPGGFIFLTEGMMKIDLTDDELAMLIGHEAAHVKLKHISKMQRRSGLLALLQQAMLIGAIVGMRDESYSSNYRGPIDPRRDPVSLGDSGKWAVVQGLATFGSLFRNLLELGYSRKYEFEADHSGFLFATRTGYKAAALEGLMQKLHNHIYETPGITYWRTHPYFSERIERARAKSRSEQPEKEISAEQQYRQRSQADFLKAMLALTRTSENYREKKTFLETLAFQAHPRGKNTDWILYNILTSKRLAEQEKPSVSRDYGKLLKQYDRAEKLLQDLNRESPRLDIIRAEHQELTAERTALLPHYLQILDRDEVSVPLLKTFISNYPDHDRIAEAHVRLGENYRLGGEIKEAAKILLKVKSLPVEEEWKSRSDTNLRLLIPQIKDPSLCLELIQEATEADRKIMEARLNIIIEEHLTFENISTFFEQWALSDYIQQIKTKWELLAQREYNRGRIFEATQEYQQALDSYNRVVTYAGQTESGTFARQRIEIIQAHVQ